MADYSLWIVEYARVKEYPVSAALYGRHNQGSLVLPYCYGILKSDDHLAVVDTGFDNVELGQVMANTYGVTDWQPPEVVMSRLGFSPEDVDTVILTHNHFDHAGGVRFFPNAHVYLQAREVHNYLYAKGLPHRMQWLTTATDPDLVLYLVERMTEGKLTLLDGEAEVLPGVRAVPAHDTHTAGSQYVTLDQHDGRWLLAGDNCYTYDNFLGSQEDGMFCPIGFAMGNMQECVLTMEEMWQFVGEEVTRIVPFHAEEMWEKFPTHVFDDTLRAAELSLAPGEASRLEPLKAAA
jgi:glyoxylase-like metal-dependent hydrolase (beta-lactamase superfamily II)